MCPLNHPETQVQFHKNTDKIVKDRLEAENYHFSNRASQHMEWVLRTGRNNLGEENASDKAKVQTAERHLNELIDSIVAQAKSRNEVGTISYTSVSIACRDKVGKNWPL